MSPGLLAKRGVLPDGPQSKTGGEQYHARPLVERTLGAPISPRCKGDCCRVEGWLPLGENRGHDHSCGKTHA